MKTYIGTKIVKAHPATYKEFAIKTGTFYQDDRKQTTGKRLGYLVEYDNGHKSWTPKDVFEKHYVEIEEDESDNTETYISILTEQILASIKEKIPYGIVKSSIIVGIQATLSFLKVGNE